MSDNISRAEFELRVFPAGSRAPRLHVVSFDGTLAGGLWSSRKTVVPAFVDLISEHENVYETPLNGVGADGSWADFLMGGIGGWGTLRNVVNALKNLSKRYRPGDRIILSGWSRGAWAARCLAMLISVIGIPKPKNGDEKLFNRIYKACNNKSIWKDEVAAELMRGHDSWENVRINALCCFDTVGSLGLPLTGVAKPLAILRGWGKKHDIVSNVAPNVDFAFHALALHEEREPFTPTLMRGSCNRTNIIQVFFPGAHGNLGWIADAEGLVHGPLAWMVEQVHRFLHISFDDDKLAARFPSYRREDAPEPTIDAGWYKGEVDTTNLVALACMGKKIRKPGRVNCANGLTDLKIHIGARLRNYGAGSSDDAVPGYGLRAPARGPHYWVKGPGKKTWSWKRRNVQNLGSPTDNGDAPVRRPSRLPTWGPRTNSNAMRIEEAPVGALEARCLGLPLSVVT